MKAFFASMLGSLAGLVLFFAGGGLLLFGLLLFSALVGSEQAPTVRPGSYLVFDLGVNIQDTPEQFDSNAFTAMLGDRDVPGQLQLRAVTRALREAARDDAIAGVYVTGSFAPSGYGTSFAALREVRDALAEIRAAGKPIAAHLLYADTRDLYVASVASDLSIDPSGILAMPGLASQPMFYTGAFEKFGIGVQTARAGRYKSAIEPFTRRDLSAENREQLQELLDALWGDLRDTIAEARGIDPVALQTAIDAGDSYLVEDALALGLVDRLAYTDELMSELQATTGVGRATQPFKQVSLPAYMRQLAVMASAPEEQAAAPGTADGRIAIVYAEGAIVDGQGGYGEVGGLRFARELRRLRQTDDVKAIVLRVNSPGGSATASEQIRRELELAGESMPVVVSMGGYAASGGYWISSEADRIFAEPTTITGSIGVFGMLLNVQELGNDLGFTWDTVKTGEFADALTIARPKSAAEMALFQRGVDGWYDEFLQRVADGRGLTVAQVDELAQGRVWSGQAALQRKLVDEIGGLSQAVAWAAQEAGLAGGFQVSEYPRKKELADVINDAMSRLQRSSVRSGDLLTTLGRQFDEARTLISQFNDPRGLYARLPVELIVR